MDAEHHYPSLVRPKMYLYHGTMIVLHIIVALVCYLFLPWEEIQESLAIASAVLVTFFLVSLFIWWSLFGEDSSLTNDEGLLTRDN